MQFQAFSFLSLNRRKCGQFAHEFIYFACLGPLLLLSPQRANLYEFVGPGQPWGRPIDGDDLRQAPGEDLVTPTKYIVWGIPEAGL